jgi:hypothetical protein
MTMPLPRAIAMIDPGLVIFLVSSLPLFVVVIRYNLKTIRLWKKAGVSPKKRGGSGRPGVIECNALASYLRQNGY